MINKVPQGAGRIANDKNFAMVALLHALGNLGWTPPETMTKAEWSVIMKKQNLPLLPIREQAEFAFAATGPTFGSMWCGQWAKDYPGMEGTRYRQARDAALKDAPGLKGIVFYDGEYDALTVQRRIPKGSLVYCDPPYANTTEYSGAVRTIPVGGDNLNNWKAGKFWRWCDYLIDDLGCDVYVSEYQGPAAGIYPSKATPEQAKRLADAKAEYRRLQADESTPTVKIEDQGLLVLGIDDEIKASGAALAARWKPVWSKEVVSDFSASRSEENEEKRTASWRKYLRGTTEWEENQQDEIKWFKTMIPADHYKWPPGEKAPVVMDAGKKEMEHLFHREG